MIATLGDARQFENGRQLAAWLGIVPKQHSTGGKARLLGISKRGDRYLRTLLIHGARAVVRIAERKADAESWIKQLLSRRNKNVAAVALANKNARTIWALLAHDRDYEPDYVYASGRATLSDGMDSPVVLALNWRHRCSWGWVSDNNERSPK